VEDRIISLAAQIVSAHVANNDVSVQQLPAFIRQVHEALAAAGQALSNRQSPSLPWR
jgi:predicted transcriptional regulator